MDIITRAEARRAGLNRYFTGVPCKNGHVDFRYTASGACKGCIAVNNGRPSAFTIQDDPEVLAAKIALDAATVAYSNAVRAAESRRQAQEQVERAARLEAVQSQREEMETLAVGVKQRQEAKAQLVQIRVRCYDADRDHVAVAVWALAVMRWPFLTQGDVDPKLLPKDKTAGTGLYAFYCHDGDISTVRAIAAESMKAHKVNVEARRQELLRQLDAAANVDTAPEWRP